MSRGATARLFVAVEPPLSVREELAEWARAVAAGMRAAGSSRGALRLLDVESLHLTLCFLGSRPVAEIDVLGAALAASAESGCELSIGAPLWLPPRRPHALAVEIHDRDGELERLHEIVTAELSGVSAWRPERRRFRAHITLARVRGGAGARRRGAGSAGAGSAGKGGDRSRAERVEREPPLPATPQLSFVPEAIVLYRSWLSREGASYEALASSELAVAGR
jgi:RNA 2',3'-cyclic 3'-phosphodiesterase